MGYSIYAIFKDKKSAKQMADFMHANFRYPHDFMPGIPDDKSFVLSSTTEERGLSYCHHENAIGFDYKGVQDPERIFIYMIVYWMGLRSDYRENLNGKLLPAVSYDGCETILVFKNEDPTEDEVQKMQGHFDWVKTDEDGWHFPNEKATRYHLFNGDYLSKAGWKPTNDEITSTINAGKRIEIPEEMSSFA